MNRSEAPSPEQSRDQSAPAEGPGTRERVTVNLTAKGAAALSELMRLTGDTKTDVINRALGVYAYLETVEQEGGKVYVREQDGADLERVRFL
ncbi:hypothetical protein DZF91_10365 [Actinomadura logoneensis]|uniref:CopG family transcriptional regulator n=1 Tax=Actinomadura logoneensis TaxID=2293572 RepID=A0A372JNW4_9ACTN|nr:hypothetical protein [Actinomadura logoneensis]RFU41715.1 hypothetical protein DZF91_10365 [Actinomadura logoneensis]